VKLEGSSSLQFKSLLEAASRKEADTILEAVLVDFPEADATGRRVGAVTVEVGLRNARTGLVFVDGVGYSWYNGPASISNVNCLRVASKLALDEAASRYLPEAVVLNTLETRAIISRGKADGYQVGLTIFFGRGRELITDGEIVQVDAQTAIVKVWRTSKGIQPGDSVYPINTRRQS
jgi:hypothetical protein